MVRRDRTDRSRSVHLLVSSNRKPWDGFSYFRRIHERTLRIGAERILDQVADAVIYATPSGVLARWNCGSAALFGYSAEEALGRSLDLIIPEHLRASHWRGFNAAMTSGAMKLQGRPTTRARCTRADENYTSR